MSEFSIDWNSYDLQVLIFGTIVTIGMLFLSYKWYRSYKDDEDTGEWYSVMNGWDIVRWIVALVFLIMAIISQVDFS